jgi:hypothetical protein
MYRIRVAGRAREGDDIGICNRLAEDSRHTD